MNFGLDAVRLVVFLAPGFLALKVFYVLGAQLQRSQWEWTTWSIVVSLPINGLAPLTVALVLAATGWQIAPAFHSTVETGVALCIAIASGAFGAAVWSYVGQAKGQRLRRVRRAFEDSAWDRALDEAGIHNRALVLVMDDGTRYRGQLKYGGREGTGSSGWLYLAHPSRKHGKDGGWDKISGTDGLLVDRDKVRLIQVYQSAFEDEATRLRKETRTE